jgi:hypothetical protein
MFILKILIQTTRCGGRTLRLLINAINVWFYPENPENPENPDSDNEGKGRTLRLLTPFIPPQVHNLLKFKNLAFGFLSPSLPAKKRLVLVGKD